MEAVKEAILDDFEKWLNETSGENFQDQLDDFMEEQFEGKFEEGNIFEHIKAMSSPPSSDNVQEGKSYSAGLQTLAACGERDGQNASSALRKSLIEGLEYFWNILASNY